MTARPGFRPLIVTPGEPGGVGGEITLKAWKQFHDSSEHCFAVIADVDHLNHIARQSGEHAPLQKITSLAQAHTVFQTAVPVLHRPLPCAVSLGQFTPLAASWVLDSIAEAVDFCIAGDAAAMVTNPIQKEALYAAGFKYQGHTDFLGALCAARGVAASEVMMLVGGGLRAVPLTVHIALKDVPQNLTQTLIMDQARTVNAYLKRYFGIEYPRIAVTGLNPHAGENGAMGVEEINIIRPAIAALKNEGLNVFGPLPADTAFFPRARESYDVILCMYHDQALIPVKTLDFHGGVNVTLGLPFIRTSPDHGTALDLAGRGLAQGESLMAAMTLAMDMAKASHQ
jgi:4-hydroxythreonine-4-phosphate dehydrogenase